MFAKYLNPDIKVVGCDAIETYRDDFYHNLALNGISSEGVRWIAGYVGLSATPLDTIAAQLPTPITIKVDVDGGEVDVLSSGIQTLSKADTQVVLEVHSEELEQKCLALLQQHGFDCKIVDRAWWRRLVPEQRPGWCRWVIASKPIA